MEAVTEMLAAATSAVKASPTDPSARMKLFRLFCLTGQWERAVTQLDTASGIDAQLAMTSLVYKQALACERFRAQVFAGQRTPVVLGEPQAWLGWMIEALRLEGTGASSGAESAATAAAALRAQALEAAEARPGRLNDAPFAWIADADARLGPVCEAFIDGKYYWLPFERIASLTIVPPDDLIDLVWTSAELVFDNQGVKQALIPTRYPGTEALTDDGLRLARRTEWLGSEAGGWRGVGQREFVTDGAEIGLCDVRSLALD